VRRDLALLVREDIAVDELVKSIKSATSEIIQEILLFDIYKGKGIENGRNSVALGLILQDNSKTLVEQDVEGFISDLLNNLKNTFNAQLRE